MKNFKHVECRENIQTTFIYQLLSSFEYIVVVDFFKLNVYQKEKNKYQRVSHVKYRETNKKLRKSQN